jgi:Uma2 family endonuclease
MVAAVPLPYSSPPQSPSQPPSQPPPQPLGEQRVLLSGVPWETYVALRDAVDTPGVRMTYIEGLLEIMTPLPAHELAKTMIARLIEMFAIERDVPLQGYGSTTFRSAAKARGLEPDECYCVDHLLKDVPDIALEVVLTSGGIEKLPVYEGLGVKEVWFWEKDAFHLYALRAAGYEAIPASELVPGLDLEVLAAFARRSDQHETVKAFRDWLRSEPPR